MSAGILYKTIMSVSCLKNVAGLLKLFQLVSIYNHSHICGGSPFSLAISIFRPTCHSTYQCDGTIAHSGI